MWRKLLHQQLCSPVFSVIRRHLLLNCNKLKQSRNLLVFSSYVREKPRVCQISEPQLFANARFSGRKLCSDSRVIASCWNCNAVAANMIPFLEEREYAAEQSARVIDAYRTLTDALERATYIMRLSGVELDEEKTISESELLSEIMEIREAVEEAADPQALNKIKAQMQQKLRFCGQVFANAFRNKNYEEAQMSIQRMTYYKRVNEEIVKKL